MKKTILPALLLLVLSLSFASAFSFSNLFESWTYTSNPGQGFSLTYQTNVPEIKGSVSGCPYVDWSSDGRKCRKTLSLTNPANQDKQFSYDAYFDARHRYNADKELANAHRTYDAEVRQKTEITKLQIKERNRYRSSYFGYSYYPGYYYW